MINAAIHILREPDGTAVGNAVFDLSRDQLRAAAHAANVVRLERHRGFALDTDDVLALRELTAICDELDRLMTAEAHSTVAFPLARLVTLHDALHEYVAARAEIDPKHLRPEDRAAVAIVEALLHPMEELRCEGLEAVLGATHSHPAQ